MAYLHDKRMDLRSPISDNAEEEQSGKLFEKRQPLTNQPSNRPQSAKPTDLLPGKVPKRKGGRPISANKQGRRLKPVPKKESDMTFLARLKPRNIAMDKERLYEENMSLKLQNNALKEDIVRLRTKLNSMERETAKKDEVIEDFKKGDKFAGSFKNLHLVNSLKQTIKDLKSQLQARDENIGQLKKNIKNTKYGELEIEIQAYIDECTRLRHHLEELMRQRETPHSTQGFTSLEEKHNQQSAALANLKKENEELQQQSAQNKEECARWRERFIELEKKKKPTKKADNSLKLEIQKLRAQLDSKNKELENKDSGKLNNLEKKVSDQNKLIEKLQNELRGFKQKKLKDPPKFLKKVMKLIAKRKIQLTTLFENRQSMESSKLLAGLNKAGANLSPRSFEKDLKSLNAKEPLTLRTLEEWLDKYEYDESSSSSPRPQKIESPAPKKEPSKREPVKKDTPPKQEDLSLVQDSFKHISMRMQLHRLPKSQLSQTLFSGKFEPKKQVTKQALQELLKKAPFSFKTEELSNLINFLLSGSNAATQEEVSKKMNQYTEDWEIFNSSDEDDFDKQLGLILSKNKVTLKEACKTHDPSNTGLITLDELSQVLKDIELDFPPSLFRYITLLFYSHSYELNSVPYRNFLKAYSEPRNEEEDDDEEEKAKVVRSYLAVIAQHLNDKGLTVRKAFKFDREGLIYPKEFVEALQMLEIEEIEQEIIALMLEALQYEEEEENMCVHVEELEEILEHYGVPKQALNSDESPLKDMQGSDKSSVIVKDSSSEGPYESEFEESSRSRRSI